MDTLYQEMQKNISKMRFKWRFITICIFELDDFWQFYSDFPARNRIRNNGNFTHTSLHYLEVRMEIYYQLHIGHCLMRVRALPSLEA